MVASSLQSFTGIVYQNRILTAFVLYCLICAGMLRPLTVSAQTSDADNSDDPTANLVAFLRKLHSLTIPMPQLADMVATKGAVNPIADSESSDITPAGVYRKALSHHLSLSDQLDWTVIKQCVDGIMGGAKRMKRRVRNDTDQTATLLGLENFARLSADTYVSPDDSHKTYSLMETVWLQRTPLTYGQIRKLVQYHPELAPREMTVYAGDFSTFIVNDDIPFGAAGSYRIMNVIKLLDHLNGQLSEDYPWRFDLPTMDEIIYATAVGLGRLYEAQPTLFNTDAPHHLVSRLYSSAVGGRIQEHIPPNAPFLDTYYTYSPDTPVTKASPLIVKGKRIWGLLGSIRVAVTHTMTNHPWYTDNPIGYIGLPELSNPGPLSHIIRMNHDKIIRTGPSFQYWVDMLTATEGLETSEKGVRFALRPKTSPLQYKRLEPDTFH